MDNPRVVFRIHAIQRMFERRVSAQHVQKALHSGRMVEDYSDDMPFPSSLILSKQGTRPLHVVVAENTNDNELIVITAYEPNTSQWRADFESRKL